MKQIKKIILILILPFLLIGLFAYREYNLKKLKESQNQSQSLNQDNTVVCTEEYDPVCGEDSNTYSNKCVAEKQNKVKVKYNGVCESKKDTGNDTDTGTGIGENNLGDTNDGQSTDTGTLNNTENTPSSTVTDSGTLSLTGTTSSGAVAQTGTINGEKVLNYFNSNFNYGFSVPAKSYYSGFGSKYGANHTVGINFGKDVVDLDSSDVKVFLYKDKIIDELKDSHYGLYKEGNKIYLQIGNSSVIIENSGNQQKIVDMIIKTIYVK